MKTFSFLVLGCMLACSSLAVSQHRIPQSVSANGGGKSTNTQHHISGTMGQSFVGRATNSSNIVVGGFWHPDGGQATSVLETEGPIPAEFALVQNYPNPFNPSTNIKYQISRPTDGGQATASYVVLKVYNLLGQEVVTLVDEIQEPGFQSVVWNAGSAASGVYFYRLQTGPFVQTRKMLLQR